MLHHKGQKEVSQLQRATWREVITRPIIYLCITSLSPPTWSNRNSIASQGEKGKMTASKTWLRDRGIVRDTISYNTNSIWPVEKANGSIRCTNFKCWSQYTGCTDTMTITETTAQTGMMSQTLRPSFLAHWYLWTKISSPSCSMAFNIHLQYSPWEYLYNDLSLLPFASSGWVRIRTNASILWYPKLSLCR